MVTRGRRRDLTKLRDAASAQWAALLRYTERLSPAELAAPSTLPGWTVAELIAHIAQGTAGFAARLGQPAPAQVTADLLLWAQVTPAAAEQLADAARSAAAAGVSLDTAVAEAEAALRAETADRPVAAPGGAGFALSDMLVTRLVEAVVHADDLDPEFPHAPTALAIVTRALTDLLAMAAPGHTVEVRVPPYAVTQCVAGPRHTRGTPPNVVETDPLTWLRLATGRLNWADAVASGRLSASGERSDLTDRLPLLR
jgi:uncharacterized protein (TIGR03083 family)